MNWTDQNRALIIPALVFVILALALGILFKHGVLSFALLSANKDFFGALSNIATIVALALGGLLSYYRFFRGRIFTTSAEIDVSVNIIELPTKERLHAVSIKVKNVGTMAIWDPRLKVMIDTHGTSKSNSRTIDNWFDAVQSTDGKRRTAVINAGETATFLTHEVFSPDVWAITYLASVESSTGDIWSKAVTVANKSQKQASVGKDEID